MRYIMSMAGGAGFALVLGLGLWRGVAWPTALLGGLLAAVGFGRMARLWMEMILKGREDSLLARQATAHEAAKTEAETEFPAAKEKKDFQPPVE